MLRQSNHFFKDLIQKGLWAHFYKNNDENVKHKSSELVKWSTQKAGDEDIVNSA